jgi:hypothetical protein
LSQTAETNSREIKTLIAKDLRELSRISAPSKLQQKSRSLIQEIEIGQTAMKIKIGSVKGPRTKDLYF